MQSNFCHLCTVIVPICVGNAVSNLSHKSNKTKEFQPTFQNISHQDGDIFLSFQFGISSPQCHTKRIMSSLLENFHLVVSNNCPLQLQFWEVNIAFNKKIILLFISFQRILIQTKNYKFYLIPIKIELLIMLPFLKIYNMLKKR